MKKSIEVKSLFLGLLIGAVTFVTVGAGLMRGENVGRYRIVAVQDRALLLDTATGQVWQKMLTDLVNDAAFAKPKP